MNIATTLYCDGPDCVWAMLPDSDEGKRQWAAIEKQRIADNIENLSNMPLSVHPHYDWILAAYKTKSLWQRSLRQSMESI